MSLWTPAEISTALWLDASDGTTFSFDVRLDVTQWRDKSGNARHAYNARGTGYRPKVAAAGLNGLDVVRFPGSDEYLVLPNWTDANQSWFFVTAAAPTNQRYILRRGATNWSVVFRYVDADTIELWFGTDEGTSLGAITYAGSVHLLGAVYGGGSHENYLNGSLAWSASLSGSLKSTVDAGDLGTQVLGAWPYSGSYFSGDMAEIICLPSAAAAATRQQIEGYLAHKWGLTASLPAAHPYKSAAPMAAGAVALALPQPWELRANDPIATGVGQPWSLSGLLGGQMDQCWSLSTLAAAGLAQHWGLRLGCDLVEPWTDAPVRQTRLLQAWQDAGALAGALAQPWMDAAPISAGLAQGWDILAPLALGLVQPWPVAADAALVGSLAQGWDLRDVVPLSVDLAQPWSIGTDPALLRYTLAVTIDGHLVQVDSLTLEADLDQDALHATISLARLADYQRCRDLEEVVVRVAINGGTAEEYHLVQTSARIDERHRETRYEVQAESALVLLGAPYAQPVETEEYTGPASVIAATLCAPLSLDWQTVDWALPAGALVAAGETPLELLKRLASAVGAVVQARPDGSVRVVPEYPISLPAWPTATPDLVWIETERSEQVAGQPERRPGYNKYLIGETLTAADSLRLEEETVSETVKLVRGYQVPWTGLFALVHTGGSWVQVEDLGIETRQETETIEIVAGEGRVRYPIQSRDAVRWLHTSLGALTVSEDGTVRADVAGQSLCEITYTTRCRKWRVRDGRNESLQLVAEL